MKKILSLLVVLFVMLILTVTACAETPKVTELADEVTVSNISNGDFAIAAVYDEENKLEGVSLYNNKSEISVNYKTDIFDKYDNAGYLKLFVWSKEQEPRMTAYGIDLSEHK